MITAQQIKFIHSNNEILFDNINLSVPTKTKAALIGNNGSGKSTLLKILTGKLVPTSGSVYCESEPYYIPQHFGQFNNITVGKALGIDNKLAALHSILNGNISDENFSVVNDDWSIEERCQEALSYWKLDNVSLIDRMEYLSGGEKTKIFLAGIKIHQPDIILLDEPTNHLDLESREILYNYINTSFKTMLIVSHDRNLLELLEPMFEITKNGISTYGGNYSFYKEQKGIEENALEREINEKEKSLNKAKLIETETLERKQRNDARGKKKKIKEGTPKIFLKKLRNNAESSMSKIKDTHMEKINSLSADLKNVQDKLSDISKIRMNFENSELHNGKVLVTAEDINYSYKNNMLWEKDLSFQIKSGDRVIIKGENGSGKTTLIKLILGELIPSKGFLRLSDIKGVYIDQDYSLIKDELTVYEQAQYFNYDNLAEHEIKVRLHRFLFNKNYWDKKSEFLSGGEKMRLMLCCIMIGNKAPDIFILDEPTNNLDIQNIEILTSAIKQYKGTLLIVSHDASFVNDIEINQTIDVSTSQL